MKCHAIHVYILTASLMLAPCLAHAEDKKQSQCAETIPGMDALIRQPSLYILYLENDLFNGTDSDYTSGVKFSWVSANLQDFLKDPCLPHWVRQFNQFSESLHPRGDISRNMVITAGQSMFTPRDRYRTELLRTERPYAGWLYLGLGYNARDELRMDAIEVNLGVVGPAAVAKPSQDSIHDLLGKSRFNGWDNQLRNEPGIQLVAERKRRIASSTGSARPRFDAINYYGASLGNVKTYLNAGMELRIGNRIPDDFGTSPIRPTGDSNAPIGAGNVRHFSTGGVHAFVTAEASVIARDIFLDGNTFVESHHVTKKHLVGDIAGGIAWQWPGGKITYAHYIRSKEFVGQEATHGYGSITLSLEY
jgi:hypothetical protein